MTSGNQPWPVGEISQFRWFSHWKLHRAMAGCPGSGGQDGFAVCPISQDLVPSFKHGPAAQSPNRRAGRAWGHAWPEMYPRNGCVISWKIHLINGWFGGSSILGNPLIYFPYFFFQDSPAKNRILWSQNWLRGTCAWNCLRTFLGIEAGVAGTKMKWPVSMSTHELTMLGWCFDEKDVVSRKDVTCWTPFFLDGTPFH